MENTITPAVVAAATGHTNSTVTQGNIDSVLASIRALCGWHVFPSVTETITVDSDGGRRLVLPTLHMTSVERVESAAIGAPLAVDWNSAGVLSVAGAARFPRGLSAVRCTITHGYAECPADLLGVIAAMAERTADSAGGDIHVGGISVKTATGLTPRSSEWLVLSRHRLPGLP